MAKTQPARIEINGLRHYWIPDPHKGEAHGQYVPSVTSILGKTAGERANQMLAQWNERNPGAREAAAARGTAIHAACEAYVRGRPVEVIPEYKPYWDGLARHLDKFDYFVWSETPLRPDWRFCVSADGFSRVWSHEHRYSGCPDLVGVRSGLGVLLDFKTSVGPYSRYFPSENNRCQFGGWSKFSKTCVQLGAYAMAFEETLDFEVDMGEILVTTPEITQSFRLLPHELQGARYKFRQRVRQFWDLMAQESAAAEAIEAATLAPSGTCDDDVRLGAHAGNRNGKRGCAAAGAQRREPELAVAS